MARRTALCTQEVRPLADAKGKCDCADETACPALRPGLPLSNRAEASQGAVCFVLIEQGKVEEVAILHSGRAHEGVPLRGVPRCGIAGLSQHVHGAVAEGE